MTRAQGLSDFASGLDNTLKVDDTNIRVGINSTVPTTTLDVGGAVKATSFTGTTGTFSGSVSIGGTITYEDVTNIDAVGVITARSDISIADKIIHTGDPNTAIRFPAVDTFTVETGGVERVRVNSDGNIGLGIDNPTSKLHIVAPNAGGITLQTASNSVSETAFIGIQSRAYFGYDGNISISDASPGGSSFNKNFTIDLGGSERLKISVAGNVGVKQSSPNHLLHVGDNTNSLGGTADDTLPNFRIQSDTHNSDYLDFTARRTSTGTDWTTAAHRIQRKVDNTLMGYIQFGNHNTGLDLITFGKNNTEYGRFDGSGNFVIGNGSSGPKLSNSGNGDSLRITTPTGYLQLGSQNSTYVHFSTDRSRFYFSRKIIVDQGIISSYNEDLQLATNNGSDIRLSILSSNGNIGINQTSPKTKLDVNGTIISTPVSYAANQNQPYLIAGTVGYTGATTNWNTFGMQHRIKTDSSGVPRLTIDGPNGEIFCVNNAGNVGINQTNPGQKLHVVGNVQINGGVLTSLLTPVIANDAYADVVMPVKGGIIVITSFTTYDTYPQPSGTGLVYYDAGTSTGGSVMVDASNSLATSTNTSTTVGTFTDGKTTIAMINSTGSIRIWNRMGDNRKYKITLL